MGQFPTILSAAVIGRKKFSCSRPSPALPTGKGQAAGKINAPVV